MDDIVDLRTHLFDTLRRLKDKDDPMDIDRAKAVCEVADTIISSAKTEIDFARVNGSVDSAFFHKPAAGAPALPDNSSRPANIENLVTDEEPEEEKEIGSHHTPTGKVTVSNINGQRVVTHVLK